MDTRRAAHSGLKFDSTISLQGIVGAVLALALIPFVIWVTTSNFSQAARLDVDEAGIATLSRRLDETERRQVEATNEVRAALLRLGDKVDRLNDRFTVGRR